MCSKLDTSSLASAADNYIGESAAVLEPTGAKVSARRAPEDGGYILHTESSELLVNTSGKPTAHGPHMRASAGAMM